MNFKFKIDKMNSAEEAFNMMLIIAEHYDMPQVDVGPRSYKKVFRPAQYSIEGYVDKLCLTANINNPIWCMPTGPGQYILFGAV